jgi:hypothetical protein
MDVVVTFKITQNHMKTWVPSVASIALISLTYSCASAPPPAQEYPELVEAQANLKAAKLAAQKRASAEKSAAKTPAKSPSAPAPATQGEGLRKASRPPVELLTNSNATYILNFDASEAGKAAKEKCESASDDRGEVSDCLQKARARIPIESLRFVKKGREYWWITLNRYKGNLLKWHVIQFQVGEEKTDWVALRPFGKDKGIAPMARVPRQLEIELPNDFSIVMKDPEFGRLTFDAKIGLFDD